VYLPTKGAEGTAQVIIKALKNYKVKTLIYDNGLEFARHAEVSKELKARGYSYAPYHSWEKGRSGKLQRSCAPVFSERVRLQVDQPS
jgi:IS30 family transposase